MTKHKFEPFQQVLVRDSMSCDWTADFFSHMDEDNFICVGNSYLQCIPYTPETAHLLGTSQPYEPPRPPVEYELGQKVEVRISGEWEQALYITHDPKDNKSSHEVYAVNYGHAWVSSEDIRPLPDDTAAH